MFPYHPPLKPATTLVSNFKRTRTNLQKSQIGHMRQQLMSALQEAISVECRNGKSDKQIADMLNITQQKLHGIVGATLELDLETLIMFNLRMGTDVRLFVQRPLAPMQL